MATRSIKLKLALGTPKDGHDERTRLRRAVWTTHRLFNEGVAYYMRWLLLLRQEPLDKESLEQLPPGDRELFSSRENVRKELLRLAREAQRKNGCSGSMGTDEEMLATLRQLYEAIVPSSIGKKGDANKISRAYQSVLVDPKSEGGLGTSNTGAKPAWMSMPEGPERDEKMREWQGRRDSLATEPRAVLKKLSVLPLFTAYNRTWCSWQRARGEKKDAILTSSDRDMFQQALERLMSWESWNRRVADEWEKKKAAWDALQGKYLTPMPDWRRRLRAYEADRENRLGRSAIRPEEPYRLGERTIRGWSELREKWLKLPAADRTEAKLKTVLAAEQTEKRGRLGDASDFIPWLARTENHQLWSGQDHVRVHVILNEAERALSEAKETARYTPPHALDHPLWARSDRPGGSNIHDYDISEHDGSLVVRMRLQHETESGRIVEADETIPLRPTGQWNQPQRAVIAPLQIVSYDAVPKEALAK